MAGRAPMLWIWYWVAAAMVQSSWTTGTTARSARSAATRLPHRVQPARRGAECEYLDQKSAILRYTLITPSWHRLPDTQPPASHIPMIDEDALHCRRQSTVPAPAATPAPPHNIECKCLRISPSSTAARRTRCPTPDPGRPCSPPPPPTRASP